MLLVLWTVGGEAWANTTIAGGRVAESVVLEDGTQLELNGAGVRTKSFVKIDLGALYLCRRMRDAEDAMAMPAGQEIVLTYFANVGARVEVKG